MKTFKYISMLIVALSLLNSTASAHSGRTDSNGGHHDNINGGYHYHSKDLGKSIEAQASSTASGQVISLIDPITFHRIQLTNECKERFKLLSEHGSSNRIDELNGLIYQRAVIIQSLLNNQQVIQNQHQADDNKANFMRDYEARQLEAQRINKLKQMRARAIAEENYRIWWHRGGPTVNNSRRTTGIVWTKK